ELPFWFDLGLSPGLIAYVAGLTIAGGAIVGVLPALKATGKRIQAGLQQLSSRGSQMQLGRTWTALIVVQVAIAVAVLPGAIFYTDEMVRFGTRDPGYAADEFISAALSMQRDGTPQAQWPEEYERAFVARFADRADALRRRLEAEPGVAGVTFATRYPGTEAQSWIEVESNETPSEDLAGRVRQEAVRHRVGINNVGVGLLEMFDVPILAGRTFVESDTRDGSNAVIVDKTFADRIAGGANVLGRRIWYVDRTGNGSGGYIGERRWFQIVGVVPDFPVPMSFTYEDSPNLYHPITRGQAQWLHLIIRMRGAPAAFTTRLRNIAANVDPGLQLHDLMGVAESRRLTQQALRMTAIGVVAVTLSVLLLSAAGIYAMMSFTVARRRREIGIRAALGAGPRRVLTSILGRATGQLGIGVVVGLILAAALESATGGSIMGGKSLILLPIVSALMMGVGLLAALGPARRGLSVQPTEALREE
ncbi:MAG: ABC transporter permease, partial [Longimicrobiales bacterium]